MSQLTVASLNLCNFAAPPFASYEWHNILSNEQWQLKRQWLVQTIKGSAADLIAFQEVFSIDELQTLCQELGYPHFTCPARPNLESDFIFSHPCVAIASRLPIIPTQLTANQSAPFARVPAIARVTLSNGKRVTIFSVHLKSQRAAEAPQHFDDKQAQLYGQWVSSFQRADEAKQLLNLAQSRLKRGEVIITGDFNQALDSSSLKSLTESGEFHSLFAELNATPLATYYYRFNPIVIDHMLISSKLTPRFAHCIDDHLPTNGQQSSDHAMIIGQVELSHD